MNRRTFFGGVTTGVLTGVGAVKASVVPSLADNESVLFVERDGTQVWLNQYNERHRIGGPAMILANGTKAWYQNGEPHRIDGPAVIFADGAEHWYQDGERHRIGGPAIIRSDGIKYWYEYGMYIPCSRS